MISAPVDGESVTSLLLMYQRKFGGGLEDARQPNDTVSPTVAFTDRGRSVHVGLPASTPLQRCCNGQLTTNRYCHSIGLDLRVYVVIGVG